MNETFHYYINNIEQRSAQTLNLDAAYNYDIEGKMTSVNYPTTYTWNGSRFVASTGPTYTYSFDAMDRPTGLKDQNNAPAVSNVSYNPANQLLGITYFGTIETRQYNNMNQMTSLGFTGGSGTDTITYTFPAGTNNGKISQQSDSASGETVTYQYDSLNRLLSGTSNQGWSETYGYDAFGNLVSKTPTGGAPTLSQAVNAATNQIVGQTYDGNGNQTSGGYTYDAENRLVSATGVQYAYDSRNKRIWKATLVNGNMTQEVYFYGVDGQKLGTYPLGLASNGPGVEMVDGTAPALAVFFGGKRVGLISNGITSAFAQNRLGSNQGFKFYPYGEARGTPPADTVGFATYTRDSATELDYADQRYYANNYGRFMSIDWSVNGLSLRNPSTWNRYTYVAGDPANQNDPDGLCADYIAGITQDPNTGSGKALLGLTGSSSVVAFPYAGQNAVAGANEVNSESNGTVTYATVTAADSANFALEDSPSGKITLIVFSGGAQAINTYFQEGKLNASDINYVVYVEPGFGFGQDGNILRGTQGTYWITNPYYSLDQAVNEGKGTQVGLQGVTYESTTCKHDFACVLQQFSFLITPLLGTPCRDGAVLTRHGYVQAGGGQGGGGSAPPNIPGKQDWCRIFGGSWCPSTPPVE